VGQARRADRAGLRQVIGAPVEVPWCGSIWSSPNASPNAKSAQSAVSSSRSFTAATRSTSEGELTCRIFPQAEPIDHRDFRRKRQKLRKADSTCRQLRCGLGTLRRGSKRRAGELDCAREPDTATVHSRRTPTTARSTQAIAFPTCACGSERTGAVGYHSPVRARSVSLHAARGSTGTERFCCLRISRRLFLMTGAVVSQITAMAPVENRALATAGKSPPVQRQLVAPEGEERTVRLRGNRPKP